MEDEGSNGFDYIVSPIWWDEMFQSLQKLGHVGTIMLSSARTFYVDEVTWKFDSNRFEAWFGSRVLMGSYITSQV